MLSAEEIKDIVCSTSIWLVVRGDLVGLARRVGARPVGEAEPNSRVYTPTIPFLFVRLSGIWSYVPSNILFASMDILSLVS